MGSAERTSMWVQSDFEELGLLEYVNLSSDLKCSFDEALQEAQRTKKPLFVNFVEFPG